MTFRVILRKDVIYKNNTSPLCLLFFHDNRKKSVGLGVSVVRSCWDAQAQKVTDDCPDGAEIKFQITMNQLNRIYRTGLLYPACKGRLLAFVFHCLVLKKTNRTVSV